MLKSIGAAALLITAASSQAHAAAPQASIRISYADLDLSRAAGQAALAARLHRAIDTLCPGADSRQLDQRMAARTCARAASLEAGSLASRAIARARGIGGTQLAAR